MKLLCRFKRLAVKKLIQNSDELVLSDAILAIVKRYGQLHSDWDVCFLSLPKDPEERKEQLERVLYQISQQ